MAYTITQRFISRNRSNIQLKAIGTFVHETSDPGATDENEFNYFNWDPITSRFNNWV